MKIPALDVAVAGPAVALVALGSIPHLYFLCCKLPRDHSGANTSTNTNAHTHHDGSGNHQPRHKSAWYDDLDGRSTAESVAEYDARLRRVKAANLTLAAVGTGVAAIVAAVAAGSGRGSGGSGGSGSGSDDTFLSRTSTATVTPNPVVLVACWAAVLAQVCVTAASFTAAAFRLGAWSTLSCAVILVLSLLELRRPDPGLVPGGVPVNLAQVLLAGLLLVGCASIPRRPDLYDPRRRGIMIDPEWSSSLVSQTWYGFFGRTTISAAIRNEGRLEVSDLTRPGYAVRSSTLARTWPDRGGERAAPLWRRLAWMHRWKLLRQWAIGVVLGTSRMAPAWALRQLLAELERPSEDGTAGVVNRSRPLAWTALLVFIMVFETWTGHITYSYAWSRFALPVRNELASAIVQKTLRAKEMYQPDRKEKDGKPARAGQQAVTEVGANIIGIDVELMASFCANHVSIPTTLTALVEACVLLGITLGLRPMLCGLAVMPLVVAIGTIGMRRYWAAQLALMAARDGRTAVVSEALSGIRQIKFAALEDLWEASIGRARDEELVWVEKSFVASRMLLAITRGAPLALTLASLTAYGLAEGQPRAPDVFACVAMFRVLTVALSSIPEAVKLSLDAWVSAHRIEAFLGRPEVCSVVDPNATAITLRGASVAWPWDPEREDDASPPGAPARRFVLRDLNLAFPAGRLSLVTGRTGTGKTLLLSAILGESDVIAGTVSVPPPARCSADIAAAAGGVGCDQDWIVPNATAYAAQTPWIENASVAANIMFGLPLVRARLDAVLEACALVLDLAALPDGESTEVGADGVNLSGGQKWRVSLARAIYSRASILVLDDMFSAVDAHVGRHLLERCLRGPLCDGRTVIMVTHHASLILSGRVSGGGVAYMVELGEGGTVTHAGPVSDHHGEANYCPIRTAREGGGEEQEQEEEDATSVRKDSSLSSSSSLSPTLPPIPRKFVEDEQRARGAVAARVWTGYLVHAGRWPVGVSILIITVLMQITDAGTSWWLRIWTGSGSSGADVGFYLAVYAAMAVLDVAITMLRSIMLLAASLRASRSLFTRLNAVVLRAPATWFDRTPLGRILNRYTADLSTIDVGLAPELAIGTNVIFGLIATLVAAAAAAPSVLLGVAVLIVPWLPLARGYLAAARPCRRLTATTRAVALQSFLAMVRGVTTLRAFGRTGPAGPAGCVLDRIHDELDDWAMATAGNQLCTRWMGVRTGTLSAVFSGLVAVFAIFWPGVSAGTVGFALAFAFTTNSLFFAALDKTYMTELAMSSTERILEYSDPVALRAERPHEGRPVPAAWPTRGDLEVHDLTVAYADDLPPVLKGVSFHVRAGERVGVVGRTGAGKSTLTLSLFRFLDPRAGSICIDGLDISAVKLAELRSRMCIIPQDPILFSGTIRSNLDPLNQYSDPELIDALRRVHLGEIGGGGGGVSLDTSSSSAPEGHGHHSPSTALSTAVTFGGLNLSQGQRQLLCLARAIVARPKIVVLDEATSAVDRATDRQIQMNIRSDFTATTLIVVAHRLATVADFDKILVLAGGEVVEFGTPRELWGGDADKRERWGAFRAMCESSGDARGLRATVVGGDGSE